MHTYEIEIKSLLGSAKNAEKIKKAMSKTDPDFKLISQNKQLNHYFTGGELQKLFDNTKEYLSPKSKKLCKDLIQKATDFSVRTREKNSKEVIFVIKASVGDSTSSNGISRIELEEKVPLTLSKLDKLILKSGFEYQAKWSREREEYAYNETNVCLDKNAGYGYLAEFEKVVDDKSLIQKARRDIRSVMKKLGVNELKQDRLGRMFEHYNKNWDKYYGTDKTFTIK